MSMTWSCPDCGWRPLHKGRRAHYCPTHHDPQNEPEVKQPAETMESSNG